MNDSFLVKYNHIGEMPADNHLENVRLVNQWDCIDDYYTDDCEMELVDMDSDYHNEIMYESSLVVTAIDPHYLGKQGISFYGGGNDTIMEAFYFAMCVKNNAPILTTNGRLLAIPVVSEFHQDWGVSCSLVIINVNHFCLDFEDNGHFTNAKETAPLTCIEKLPIITYQQSGGLVTNRNVRKLQNSGASGARGSFDRMLSADYDGDVMNGYTSMAQSVLSSKHHENLPTLDGFRPNEQVMFIGRNKVRGRFGNDRFQLLNQERRFSVNRKRW